MTTSPISKVQNRNVFYLYNVFNSIKNKSAENPHELEPTKKVATLHNHHPSQDYTVQRRQTTKKIRNKIKIPFDKSLKLENITKPFNVFFCLFYSK